MDDLTLLGRLLGSAAGAAVGIVFFFVCIANYIIDRRPIRLVETTIFLVITLDFVVRTFAAITQPLIDSEMLMLSTVVMRLLMVVLVIVWGLMMARRKWRQIQSKELSDRFDAVNRMNEEEKITSSQNEEKP